MSGNGQHRFGVYGPGLLLGIFGLVDYLRSIMAFVGVLGLRRKYCSPVNPSTLGGGVNFIYDFGVRYNQ